MIQLTLGFCGIGELFLEILVQIIYPRNTAWAEKSRNIPPNLVKRNGQLQCNSDIWGLTVVPFKIFPHQY